MQKEISQAKDLIARSNEVIIIPGYDLQGDAFATGLALFYTLRKLGKKTTFLVKDTPQRLKFLQDDADPKKEVVMTISSRDKKFEQMRYENNPEELKIYFTLGRGDILPADISLNHPSAPQKEAAQELRASKPDLIITIGAQNLEAIISQATIEYALFYETTTLNVDNQVINENFGNLNLVDPSAISLAEIVTDLIISIDPSMLKGDTATRLLTGLICATQNWQHPRTGPRTLSKAALLMENGADHEIIIKRLYKTKALPQMRLLGKALQSLHIVPEKELAVTALTEEDFAQTKTDSRDLAPVLEDIKTNFPQLPSLLLLWESHGSGSLIKGILSAKNSVVTDKILGNFEGVSRNNTVLFLVREEKLKGAEEAVLNILP